MEKTRPDSVLLDIDLHPIKTKFAGQLAQQLFSKTNYWDIAESIAIDYTQEEPVHDSEVNSLLTDIGAKLIVQIRPRNNQGNFLLLDVILSTCWSEYTRRESILAPLPATTNSFILHDLLATLATENNHHTIGTIGTN